MEQRTIHACSTDILIPGNKAVLADNVLPGPLLAGGGGAVVCGAGCDLTDALGSGDTLAGGGAEEEEGGAGGAGDFVSSLSSPLVPWAAALAASEALLPAGGGGR